MLINFLGGKQMSKKIQRLLTLLVTVVMAASLLAGCGTAGGGAGSAASAATEAVTSAASGSGAEAATTQTLDEVTLNIVLPGDPQPDQATVTAALEEAMKSDLNVKLNYSSIPWNDYAQKVKIMTASSEGIDIFWTYPELLGSLITSNSVAPLDDALAKAGQDLVAQIPSQYWPPVKTGGKTYAVPAAALGTSQGYQSVIVRKDLREKYGLSEIKSMDDLNNFYAAVLKNENGAIIPRAVGPNMNPNNVAGGFKPFYQRGLPSGVIIDMATMKAVNAFEQPEFKQGCDIQRDWYTKGYITKDVLSVKDERAPFYSGKAASENGDVYEYNTAIAKLSAIPGAQVEFVLILTSSAAYQETTTWNFQSVAAGSPNVERAVAFINWVQKSQANYDLMTLGVKDKHYVEDGNGVVSYPEGVDASKPPYNPYEWIWQNPAYMKTKKTDAQGFLDMLKHNDDAVTVKFSGMGFLFDPTPVKTEVAALSSLSADLMAPVVNGVADPAKFIPQLDQKAKDAGIDKVIAEVQKQLDAFVATQK
jgi:putative aldouronate transport system substrate-binding protein